MENKSFYYVTSWDDAATYTRVLEVTDVPHIVEDPTELPLLQEGQLAIVLPDLPVREFDFVHKLFGGVGERYPQ